MIDSAFADDLAERIREVLFRPFAVKSLRLANRIAMAPMTRNLSPNGIPGDDVAAYYARRAAGGTGLIMTEGTSINEAGTWARAVPSFYGAEALVAWARIVAQEHAAGSTIAPQLWHVGIQAPL